MKYEVRSIKDGAGHVVLKLYKWIASLIGRHEKLAEVSSKTKSVKQAKEQLDQYTVYFILYAYTE